MTGPQADCGDTHSEDDLIPDPFCKIEPGVGDLGHSHVAEFDKFSARRNKIVEIAIANQKLQPGGASYLPVRCALKIKKVETMGTVIKLVR